MNIFLLVGLSIFAFMSMWFIVSLIIKRNDVADFAWGIGFVFVAWLSFVVAGESFKSLIINVLVTIWGVRLATHIYRRNINKPEDARYQAWRQSWKHFYLRSYLQVFLLQGLLMFLISIPIIYINKFSATFGLIDLIGISIWIFGFYFESTADRQLSDFLHNPENKGKLMDQGLWRYSRHPNYFGEVTQWWGIFICALSLPLGYLTVIGPLTVTVIILLVSGVPMLERKYKGRPDFEEYKKHTSIFIPLPPKK